MFSKEYMRKQQLNKLKLQAGQWEKTAAELLVYRKLFVSSFWRDSTTVGVTLSEPLEFDTKPLLVEAIRSEKKIVIPRTLPGRHLQFCRFDPSLKIIRSKFGVFEPQEGADIIEAKNIDLMVVPGLAFSSTGERLGFGGGFYDKFLTEYNGRVVSCAEPARFYLKTGWEIDSTDQIIPNVITPSGWFSLGQKRG